MVTPQLITPKINTATSTLQATELVYGEKKSKAGRKPSTKTKVKIAKTKATKTKTKGSKSMARAGSGIAHQRKNISKPAT